MSEEKKIVELSEEELEKVTGGAGGNIPKGGITYSTYTSAYGGRFYAKCVGGTDLIRTETTFGSASYYEAKLIIDKENNTWTVQDQGSLFGQPKNFFATYPYVLNIKP